MRTSVFDAISCLAEISSDRTLEEDSTLMAVSSSRMLPCKYEHNVHDNIEA